MEIEAIRKHCLKLPHATENIQWGNNLCFKVAGKLFAIVCLEPAPVRISFKCTPENFAELTEREGIIPAPYMARAHWAGLQELDTLQATELQQLISESYRVVFQRLPKKVQAELSGGSGSRKRSVARPETG